MNYHLAQETSIIRQARIPGPADKYLALELQIDAPEVQTVCTFPEAEMFFDTWC